MTSPRSQNGPAKAAVGRKRLVIHGRDGHCAALYTATGETDWEIKDQGTDGQAPALGTNNTAYFGGRKLTARRLDRGDFLWEEEAGGTAGVWGTPTATDELVFAMNRYNAYRYSTMPDVRFPVSDWYEVMDGTGPGTVNPPAVEGATVWLHAPDNSHIQVVHKVTRARLFLIEMKRQGTYQLASDGNRVFIARGGRIGWVA
ncbi:outer membrane protein assembly factor BamB family protein [Streptomyces massasporeus]